MKIVIAGGTGLIGQKVQALLVGAGHEVRLLVRTPRGTGDILWHPERGDLSPGAIEWADGVISLNGAPLTRFPWTRAYRRAILQSRTAATALIARTIDSLDHPPRVWLSASAVGLYGDRPGELLTEESSRGTGFLADVVAAWEAAAAPAGGSTRLVLARTGVVLGPGAMAPLVKLARWGLGGRLGTGRQYWPWIALADEAAAIVHLVTASALTGPVNLASPVPATANDITRTLARTLHRPHVVPVPAWALRALLGDAARDLLLADQHVLPQRLTTEGTFQFTGIDLPQVIRDMVKS